MSVWGIIAIVLGAVVAAGALAALITRKRDIDKVNYMMDALEDGELNFRFLETSRFNRTLNRIRKIFERQRAAQEQDSWEKLIRVLTHEIMNTVSPIASLSDAMSKSIDEPDSELDIKAGLDTISDSANNLIKFVKTYRQLSGVARPVRRNIVLQELAGKTIALNSEYISSCGAECTYRSSDSAIVIFADEGQISQIFINLIKNALQAGARRISIEGRIAAGGETVVSFANDGEPISIKSQEQIFVPFFTTKSDGSGIGLSISRQIMRQHNGSIELVRSDANETVFALTFH